MKKLGFMAVATLAVATVAAAQNTPKAELSAGYSYFRLGFSNGSNMNGFSASLAGNASDWLGIVGDFGYYHSSVLGVGVNTESFAFGPRFTDRKSDKLQPFAQVLIGGAHLSALGAGTTSFLFSLGGGADFVLNEHWALRPQFDYIGLRNSGHTTNSGRLSFSVVYLFGGK